jgi:hypothetical protein
VPIKVVRGILRSGERTFSAGTAADSKPSIAHKVNAAAPEIPAAPIGAGAKGAGSPPPPKTSNARTIAPISGTSFSTLVTIWTPPEARTPWQAMPTNSRTKALAASAGTPGAANAPGARLLR